MHSLRAMLDVHANICYGSMLVTANSLQVLLKPDDWGRGYSDQGQARQGGGGCGSLGYKAIAGSETKIAEGGEECRHCRIALVFLSPN